MIGFPVMDFVALVPTMVLFRITWRFRGGSIWKVWAGIGGGFVILALADTICAYSELGGLTWIDPLDYIAYMVGYTLTALGVIWQYELEAA